MDHTEKDSFKEYAYRVLDGFFRMTSRAGDAIRVASNRAVEKLDTLQLERRLSRLYYSLGKRSFEILQSGSPVEASDFDIASLQEDIRKTENELEFRRSAEQASRSGRGSTAGGSSGKSEKKAGKDQFGD
jgi:hypothetical protein